MWIAIVIIVLAIALAVGPVMWLRTTPSQKREIAFRNRAARLGLRVQLRPAADLDLRGHENSGEMLAGYGLLWVKTPGDRQKVPLHPRNKPWRLRRERISHESHFAGWWDWSKDLEADPAWHDQLRALLPKLPPDSLVVENNRQGLWVYWRERGDVKRVDDLAATLAALKQVGQELAIEPEPDDEELDSLL
ncbi:hypothetical protein F6455_04650 [Proteobacteria bacterium 005FR1]|nr:hypothetical protein [Proteobacteria bacterium 005FR1]